MIVYGADLYLDNDILGDGFKLQLESHFQRLHSRRDRAPITMTAYLARDTFTGQWQITAVWPILEMVALMRQAPVWGKQSPLRHWLFQSVDGMKLLINAFGPRTQQFAKPVAVKRWFETTPLVPSRPPSLVALLPLEAEVVTFSGDNGRIPAPHPPLPAHSAAAHRS